MALVRVAVADDAGEVARLVQKGANPNHMESDSIPMLMWAICANSVKGFEALLKAGANPNLEAQGEGWGDGKARKGWPNGFAIEKGWSTVMMASVSGNPEFLRLALAWHGDPNARKGERRPYFPLLLAADKGIQENLKLLLQAGADINIHENDPNSWGGANYALAATGRYDIALWLIEQGYSHDFPGLAKTAEGVHVNEKLQPFKENLINLLRAKGIVFPASITVINALKERQIPPEAVEDLIMGRRVVSQFPYQPGKAPKQW